MQVGVGGATAPISGNRSNAPGGTATTALPIMTPTGPNGTETITDYAGDLTTALTAAGGSAQRKPAIRKPSV